MMQNQRKRSANRKQDSRHLFRSLVGLPLRCESKGDGANTGKPDQQKTNQFIPQGR